MLGENFEILLYCPKIRKKGDIGLKKPSQTHSFRLGYIQSFIYDYIIYIITLYYIWKNSKMG